MMFSRRISKLTPHPRSNRRGGAMIELAIALPLLILVSIGVMDFGRVYFTSVAVSNAARAGAEWGAVTGFYTQTTNQQDFAKLDGAEAGAITVVSSWECRCPGAGVVACNSTLDCGAGYGPPAVYVTATASKTVAMLLGYPGIAPTVSISRTATFRAQ